MVLDNQQLLAARATALENEMTLLEADVSTPNPDAMAIQAQLEVIRSKYQAMDETHLKVLEELIENGNTAEYVREEGKRGAGYRQMQLAVAKTMKVLEEINPVERAAVHPPVKPDSQRTTKYPKKKLPEFGGDVREWLSFWAAFQQIDEDDGLTDAEKFIFLIQCTKENSPARRLIESFPVCAKNYTPAVDTLKAHYGRENMLVKVYVRDLLQLVVKNATGKDKVQLMELVPKLSSQIRNLEELGVTSDKCEDILYPVVESCLPEDVLQAWQRHAYFEEKLGSIMNFLRLEVTNEMDRTLAHMDLSGSSTFSGKKEDKKGRGKNNKHTEEVADTPTASAMMNTGGKSNKDKTKGKLKCQFCDKSHESHVCGKAKTAMTLEQKKAVIKDKVLCYQCLRPGHVSQKCRSYVVCSVCSGKHYELMCPSIQRNEPSPQPTHNLMAVGNRSNQQHQFMDGHFYPSGGVQQSTEPQQNSRQPTWSTIDKPSNPTSTGNFSNITVNKKRVSLHTLLATMETPVGNFTVRIFIDDGSDESYVLKEIAEKCKLRQVGSQLMVHQLFGGNVTKPTPHPQYGITLRSLSGTGGGKFVFNSSEKIAQKISKPQQGEWTRQLYARGVIIHDQMDAPEDVHLLIGMDVACQIWTGGFVRVNPTFIAKETILGWVVGGVHPSTELNTNDITTTNSSMVTTVMVNSMSPEDLWSLEMLGITDDPTSESKADFEAAALRHYKETVTRDADGRYQVSLPWIDGREKLKNNYSQAVSRLQTVTKDLKNQGYLKTYHSIFMDWKNEGIIEEVPDQSATSIGYYMPHRHVIKTSSSTTPLRPVFDASAKPKGSPSLNECVHTGPNFLELIPRIMLGFRKYEFATVSDVKKAFLQISVVEEDRDFLRFAWWEDTSCKKIKSYRHKRVVFGVKSSPFLLAATLRHHVEMKPGVSTAFRKKLLQSFYVDNSVTSHRSELEAEQFRDESQKLLLQAKFDLRGWEFGPSEEEKIVPVLGMVWNTKQDTLSLSLESTLEKLKGPSTKRGLLSMLSSVYDPMGYVCPVTLVPKLLYQKCCSLELKWDDQLPKDIADDLEKWKCQVPELMKMEIPRWMTTRHHEAGLSIHCYCDGSQDAFATCIYLRTESNEKVEVQLLAAKARVAPTKKKCTIPRLELLACLIGTRLTKEVITALEFDQVPVFYWSDSTTALAWIQNHKEWGRFVANRVAEIRRVAPPNQWNHVPGEQNPADLPSRGCTAKKLLELRWWEGPEWLRHDRKLWPRSYQKASPDAVFEELKKTVVSSAAVTIPDICQILLKKSDYHAALRIVALVNYYVDRLKHRVKARKERAGHTSRMKKNEIIPSPTSDDINRAEKGIIYMIQQSTLTGIEDQRLKNLCAFEDTDGIIRIKSQLLFGNDEFSVRCPAVLPHDNDMVKLIIHKHHEMNSHAGVQTLQAILRDHFWILKSKRTISKVVRSCVQCRRFMAKKCEVPTPQLPYDRIKDTVAFDITGVDLAGPLFLRGGEKVWVVLFTDGVYRGVHLELTRTLSTEGFLMCFRRFIDRRGRPSVVYSDNGTNFVGTNNLFQGVDWNEVLKYAAVQRISWKLNPPSAAWWGGWWERLVGLMKTLLRRILGKQVVNYDQLHTILCDVEAIMNRRPLTFVSDANGEMVPICPSFYMKDNPASGLPEADVVDSKSLQKSVRICQKLRAALRSRFRKEYLGQLHHTAGIKVITVKPGAVVLIGDDNRKRIDWPWGVVKKVYEGRDGKVRTALVQTKDGSYLRPVQRLYILEMAEQEADSSDEKQKTVGESIPRTKFGRSVKKPDRLGIN